MNHVHHSQQHLWEAQLRLLALQMRRLIPRTRELTDEFMNKAAISGGEKVAKGTCIGYVIPRAKGNVMPDEITRSAAIVATTGSLRWIH